MKTTPPRKLSQLKNRIAWEIQALTDRAKQIVEMFRYSDLFDEEKLNREHEAIKDRIESLQALDKGRRMLPKLRRTRKRIDPRHRGEINREIHKIETATGQLRAALAI